jgi:hypothetical protein
MAKAQKLARQTEEPAPVVAMPTGATARRREIIAQMMERAVPEGADIAPEPARCPIDLGAIFHRLDAHLRNHCNTALIAVPMPQEDTLFEAQFWIFEADLVHGGSIREIDLVQRATELSVLDVSCETALSHWASLPPH